MKNFDCFTVCLYNHPWNKITKRQQQQQQQNHKMQQFSTGLLTLLIVRKRLLKVAETTVSAAQNVPSDLYQ